MSQIRFATARDVFDSFLMAPKTIKSEPTDELPLDYLRRILAKGQLDDALAFCGYLLPRREVVWWGCRSVRTLRADAAQGPADGLRLAEAWVKDPSLQNRKAAEDFTKTADRNQALTWLALAVVWSGGTISADGKHGAAPPPELASHAVRVAITLSAHGLAPAERRTKLVACVEEGARLADAGL